MVPGSQSLVVPGVTVAADRPGAFDGRTDVADVIRLLRFSVALEVPTAEELDRGDVAPARIDEGTPQFATPLVLEPRAIDVADVILALRASVTLVRFAQPA